MFAMGPRIELYAFRYRDPRNATLPDAWRQGRPQADTRTLQQGCD